MPEPGIELQELASRVRESADGSPDELSYRGKYQNFYVGCYTVIHEAVNYAEGNSIESRIKEEISRHEQLTEGLSEPYIHLLKASLHLVAATNYEKISESKYKSNVENMDQELTTFHKWFAERAERSNHAAS